MPLSSTYRKTKARRNIFQQRLVTRTTKTAFLYLLSGSRGGVIGVGDCWIRHSSLITITTPILLLSHILSTTTAFTSNMSSLSSSTSKSTTSIKSALSLSKIPSVSGPPSITDQNAIFSNFVQNLDYSWMNNLSPETPENRLRSQQFSQGDDGISNNVKRPVYNGHYVPVLPKPLQNPRLVIHAPDVAATIGLNPAEVQTQTFAQFFSGNTTAIGENMTQSWATPYALSIVGRLYTSNCPFGTGDGYGDGRAISIAEVFVPSSSKGEGQRWEMQLKGAGPTPFCRGADGRAVLRSSIREFLASEAMFHLGVDTTRALSLIVSEGGDYSQRPWYSNRNTKAVPNLDDPRLAKYSMSEKKKIIAQLNAQSKNDPDVMIQEKNAITCRVARSFSRVGHFDLFARRVNAKDGGKIPDVTSDEFRELEELFRHVYSVEYPDSYYRQSIPDDEKNNNGKGESMIQACRCFLELSMEGIATMVADWLRVGFAQGNFNGDNCLIAGRTMDYGPFGFMDEYHPLFAKWTGSGDHFGFMNQPNAGYANFAVLVESIMPIVRAYSGGEDRVAKVELFQDEMMEKAQGVFEEKVNQVFRSKMGFHPSDSSPDELWVELETLLKETRADWTVFWRRLTTVAKYYPVQRSEVGMETEEDVSSMLRVLIGQEVSIKDPSSPFYLPLDIGSKEILFKWIQSWRKVLANSYKENGLSSVVNSDTDSRSLPPEERMRLANPKYVLREWMLVEAYSKASPSSVSSSPIFMNNSNQETDDSVIHELYQLIQNPYDEGTEEQATKYYRRAPDKATIAGGTAFMS